MIPVPRLLNARLGDYLAHPASPGTAQAVGGTGAGCLGRKNSEPATMRLRSAAARQVFTGCEDTMLASQTKNPVSDPARSAMPSKSTDRSRYFPALSTPMALRAPAGRNA